MEDNIYGLTEKGLHTAQSAIRLLEEGVEIDKIAEMLEVNDLPDVPRGTCIRVLVAMANESGLLD